MCNILQPRLGYDTVRISLPLNNTDQRGTIRQMESFGDYSKKEYRNGTIRHTAKMNNLELFLSENRVSISGSFPKFVNGENIIPFSITELKNGIEILSDTLNLGFSDAYVSRIDIATTLETDFAPQRYFEHLGSLGRCFRDVMRETTLQYSKGTKNNGLFKLMLYDKIREIQKNNKNTLIDGNLLRIESRFERKLSKQLQYPSVITAHTLTEPEFYNKCVDRFINDFNKIKKNYPLSNKSNVKMILENEVLTPSDIKNTLAKVAAKTFKNDVLEWFENHNFKNRSDKQRAKGMLQGMLSDNETSDYQNDLLNELELKVNNLKNCKVLM